MYGILQETSDVPWALTWNRNYQLTFSWEKSLFRYLPRDERSFQIHHVVIHTCKVFCQIAEYTFIRTITAVSISHRFIQANITGKEYSRVWFLKNQMTYMIYNVGICWKYFAARCRAPIKLLLISLESLCSYSSFIPYFPTTFLFPRFALIKPHKNRKIR